MLKALVTGGNRGIGFEVVRGLSRQGIRVFLGARDEKLGLEAAKKLQKEKLDVEPIIIDVSDPKSIECAAKELKEGVDILVNNAGLLHSGTLLQAKDKEIEEGTRVNLLGPMYCIRAFAPAMCKKGYGRIVNVSSGWGSFDEGLGGPAVYSITKAALNAVTFSVARELPQSVKINSVCPGWVRTRMGGPNATLTEKEGAETIIWLATLPDEGPTGKFFRDKKKIDW